VRVAVLDDYQRVARDYADWSSLAPYQVEFYHAPSPPGELARTLEPFDAVALMRERTPFPAELIGSLPRLRLLVTTGMRNASIDLDAASAAGVTVCGTDAAGHPTAELAWGLILALARRIPQEDASLRAGRWQTTVGTALRGKTLAVLGLGRLGGQVAGFGTAFGMRVIAWSQNLTAERAAECHTEVVTRERLFAEADVLTIHLVLGDRTRGLVGAGELASMKRTALLVNTSRGPIVDEAALAAALADRTIAGAAVDVYGAEPVPPDHPLLDAPNTLLTPHLGYVTDDNYAVFYSQTVEAIAAFAAGKPVRVIAAPP
jgi:phosphoglycerate dehydrogenase-like enzyme